MLRKLRTNRPGAHQRHRGQRHFADHEQAARAARGGPRGIAAAAFLQHFVQVGVEYEQGRRSSGDQGGRRDRPGR